MQQQQHPGHVREKVCQIGRKGGRGSFLYVFFSNDQRRCEGCFSVVGLGGNSCRVHSGNRGLEAGCGLSPSV